VLSQTNSIFVTGESANKHYDTLPGKKVLYAYFGRQPNHPKPPLTFMQSIYPPQYPS
jgi:hypothetical protein